MSQLRNLFVSHNIFFLDPLKEISLFSSTDQRLQQADLMSL